MVRAVEQKDFREKVGSFTLHGNRRGVLDNEPASAPWVLAQQPLAQQYHTLLNELEGLERVRQARRLTKDERNRRDSLRGMIGNIEKTFREASENERAWTFWRIANMRLPHWVFKAIDIEAEQIIQLSRLLKENQKAVSEDDSV